MLKSVVFKARSCNKPTILNQCVVFSRVNLLTTFSSSSAEAAEHHNNKCSDGGNSMLGSKLRMKGWQIHNYGDADELQFSDKIKMPQIRNSHECLIKINATSVNPIDVAMMGGYGSKLLNVLRCQPEIEFPLTLGREFCGQIVQRGMSTEFKHLELGDRVWGVVPVQAQGTHAEYVVVPDYCFSRAPVSLSDIEAAAVLYAGLTAWSGIYITAGLDGLKAALCMKPSGVSGKNKRILILGGSGSVGSLAIQMLKAEGAEVVATCSQDAMELVKQMGADMVMDYKNPMEMEDLRNFGPYDFVLDCSGQGVQFANTTNIQYRQYITFSSPLLRNIDSSGLGIGLAKNFVDLVEANVTSISNQKGLIKWAFFTPTHQGIRFLKELVDQKKLLPNIDSTFKFDNLPDAFKKVQEGHLRGKVVVTMD